MTVPPRLTVAVVDYRLKGNTFAFQFYPERSGPEGMRIYHNIGALIR
jgi:imidazoleglycerol phosphate synthase glutamine amidotransferase subunit HisH